jgi:hypothetical protein
MGTVFIRIAPDWQGNSNILGLKVSIIFAAFKILE